jgi:hypothetical protein
MKCRHCEKYFSVPALPEAAGRDGGAAMPSPGVFQPALGSSPVPASSATQGQKEVFALAPEPAVPQTLPPRQDEGLAMHSASPSPQQQPQVEMPPPPPPSGYEHTVVFTMRPRIIRWIAPVALFLLLILQFFPWTGVYPGQIGVYTQSAVQMIWGGFSVSPAGEKVLGMEKAIAEAIQTNLLMLLYLLLILAALVFAAMPVVLDQISYPVPRALQMVWPWRVVFVMAATLLSFLILLAFLVSGSGFEKAVIAIVDKSPEKGLSASTRDDSVEQEIERGLKLSRLNLSRTFWLHAAVFCQIVALAGAVLDLWMERRRARPLPRLTAHW